MTSESDHLKRRVAAYRRAAATHRRAEALERRAADLFADRVAPGAAQRHRAAAARQRELAEADDTRASDASRA